MTRIPAELHNETLELEDTWVTSCTPDSQKEETGTLRCFAN